MKKTFKIILSTLLALVLLISVGTVAFAEDEDVNITEDKLSVMSANVAGLPIPSKFDKDGKVVPKTQKILGQLLNLSLCILKTCTLHTHIELDLGFCSGRSCTAPGIVGKVKVKDI